MVSVDLKPIAEITSQAKDQYTIDWNITNLASLEINGQTILDKIQEEKDAREAARSSQWSRSL